MKGNWIFALIATLIVCCFVLIGIAIGERSVVGALAASVLSVLLMGLGFRLKRKRRDGR